MPALAARKRRFIFVMFVLRWAPFPKRGKNGACHLIRYLGPFEPKVQARVGYYSPCCGKQSCFPYVVQLVQCRDAAERTYFGNLSRATMATVENVPLIWQNHSRKRPQAFFVCASQARGLTYELDLK